VSGEPVTATISTMPYIALPLSGVSPTAEPHEIPAPLIGAGTGGPVASSESQNRQ
jgi:hypothetical protein